MKVYDITRPISPGIAVWPGDRPFEMEWSARLGEDSSVNVGAVSLSTHTGTHADAPLHFSRSGISIDRIDLSRFIGPAVVVDVGTATSIEVDHVRDLEGCSRVLFKTRASDWDDELFRIDFTWIHPDVVRYLGGKGVLLIGTDAPSVDPFESKDLATHVALEEQGIVNLENLYLKGVKSGVYQLFALPLKLVGLDAAPVRAVLLE